MDEKKIESEAKKIMDDFLEALEKSNVKIKEELEEGENTRDVFDGKVDEKFKISFFENFPNKKDKKLIVEKKNW